MTIFFDSRTGNVKRFIDKMEEYVTKEGIKGLHFQNVKEIERDIEHFTTPYALVTYTTNFGQVPETTSTFLERINTKLLKVVASSGNRNWGKNYGKAADLIAENFHYVRGSMKFELMGLDEDRRELLTLIGDAIASENVVTHIYP